MALASDLWKVEAFTTLGDKPSKYEGQYISLLTVEEYERLPDGTILISITGEEKVKGRDYIDLDTRGGRIAYGVQED